MNISHKTPEKYAFGSKVHLYDTPLAYIVLCGSNLDPNDKGEAMSIKLVNRAAVGQPIHRNGISIFPLVYAGTRPLGAAIADDSLQVSELDNASVPQLQVHNPGITDMLIPAGRVLEGGRQTRTVNVSILVPAGATIIIPVSCVEAGRWGGGSTFRDSKRMASRNMRVSKGRSVKSNIENYGTKNSNQGEVWDVISHEITKRNLHSDSSLFLDAVGAIEDNPELSDLITELLDVGPAENQTGIVVAYGDKITGLELFTNPDDLRSSWEALVNSIVFDSPPTASDENTVTDVAAVEAFLADIAAQEGTIAKGTGLGSEFHVANERYVAHALIDDAGSLLHAYAFVTV